MEDTETTALKAEFLVEDRPDAFEKAINVRL
jgi:hypothetical protein